MHDSAESCQIAMQLVGSDGFVMQMHGANNILIQAQSVLGLSEHWIFVCKLWRMSPEMWTMSA